VADCNLGWLKEPVSGDDKRGMAQVCAGASIPIAAGECEFSRFDFRDLIDLRAAVATSGFTLEYSLGANPMLHELAVEKFPVADGFVETPDEPGLGVTINQDFAEQTATAPAGGQAVAAAREKEVLR
jgi:L-alanine-DL-glutamate epimerase-like enolase superfamily enzyme